MYLAFLLACQMGAEAPAYTGTVEMTEVHVSALVPGQMVSVEARVGERVAAHDPLFALDDAQLAAQVALREAAVEQALAAIEAAKAQVRASQEQIRYLTREGARARAMIGAGVGTAQASSALEGQLRVAQAQSQAASQLVAQAEAGLKQAEAARAAATLQLEQSKVTSPISGVVLSQDREVGEVVSPGMSVFTLGDVDHPTIRVFLPLVQVEQIALGQSLPVRLDSGLETVGTVQWVSPRSEYTPRDILTPDERVKRVFAVELQIAMKGSP